VILPLLVLIALGCVDFGRFAYNYIAVANAARAGAGYAMMNNYSSGTLATWQANVVQAARDEMELQTGYTAVNLAVAVEPIVEADGLRHTRVTASYPFQTVATWPGIPRSSTLSQRVDMRSIR
jgi:Flp pilus assembly protein TadG